MKKFRNNHNLFLSFSSFFHFQVPSDFHSDLSILTIMKSDGSDSATTLAGNDYEPEEDLNQACVSLLRFFLHFYPPWEVVFRVILFILSGMNILLIWVSFKKQKQNWDATRCVNYGRGGALIYLNICCYP